MKTKLFQNKLVVKKSDIHGYGVFAGKNIRKGEKIEECYFIMSDCEDDILMDYIFDVGGRSGLVLGYGSMYNHSEEPNADYSFDRKRKVATFLASKTIKKGQEILVSYGDEWFSSRDMKKK
jgi:SET domain-containing protein